MDELPDDTLVMLPENRPGITILRTQRLIASKDELDIVNSHADADDCTAEQSSRPPLWVHVVAMAVALFVRQVWFDRETTVIVALIAVIPTLILSYLGVTLGWIGVRKVLRWRSRRVHSARFN